MLRGIFFFCVAILVVNGGINFLASFALPREIHFPIFSAVWMAIGYQRVLGREIIATIRAFSFVSAHKAVLLSLFWPLVKPSR